MFGYFRNRPVLFAVCCVAAVPVVGLLAIIAVATAATIRNSSPTGFAGHAAEFFGDNPHLHPFRSNIASETGDRLFGVTEAEGVTLLRVCTDDKWVALGKEEQKFIDCPEYQLARCDFNNKSLIARMWTDMGFDGVGFTACKRGLCPDFAVGEPSSGPSSSCGTPFKVQTSEQNKP